MSVHTECVMRFFHKPKGANVVLWEGWLRAVFTIGILIAGYHVAAWAGYDSDILALAVATACWFIPGRILKATYRRASECTDD